MHKSNEIKSLTRIKTLDMNAPVGRFWPICAPLDQNVLPVILAVHVCSSTQQEYSVGPFKDEKWDNSHKCGREEKLKSTQQGEDESRKSSEAQLLLLFPESRTIQCMSKWFALFKCFMHVNTHNSSNPSLIFGDKMFSSSHEIAGGNRY